jgi:hypothetical protein
MISIRQKDRRGTAKVRNPTPVTERKDFSPAIHYRYESMLFRGIEECGSVVSSLAMTYR